MRGQLSWISPTFSYSLRFLVWSGFVAIDRAADYCAGPRDPWTRKRTTVFDVVKYQRLIPASLADWKMDVFFDGKTPTCYDHLDVQFFDPIDTSVLPAEEMTRVDIFSWLLGEMGAIHLKQERLDHLFFYPGRLVQLGYKMARVSSKRFGFHSKQFAASLCMVGLGYNGLVKNRLCTSCFRLAMPGLERCSIHSQSKVISDDLGNTRSTRSDAARTARLISGLLDDFPESLPHILWVDAEALTVAGVLWPLDHQEHQTWNARIRQVLKEGSTVRKMLPEDFLCRPHREQLSLLRAAIDPNEWIIDRWPARIQAANQWFLAVGVLGIGRLKIGLNQINRSRIEQAEKLSAAGLTKGEIAIRLGISPSHLSQLFRRSGPTE